MEASPGEPRPSPVGGSGEAVAETVRTRGGRSVLPLVGAAAAVGAAVALAILAAGLFRGAPATGEYRGTDLGRDPGPLFTLTDHRGQAVSLAGLRGKVVVLTFMDSECDDVCPLVGRELLAVDRQLGDRASAVAYVAVNTNTDHASVADVAAFTERSGLGSLPNWWFLTGTAPELERVWKDYYIGVRDGPGGHLDHTAAVYVLDPEGNRRHLFTATVADSNLASLRDVLLEQVRKLAPRA